jgi:hypothetical protein
MNWFYADGKVQNGPVTDSQLDELLRAGKISPTTQVWREGMSQWQPLNAARAGGQAGNVCVECGKTFPPDETIKLNNLTVCAQCKPILLQRMQEGAALPMVGNLWRQNKRLVTRTRTIFPNRCVKCNAPANFRLKRTLYWVHPAYLLLILCNLIVLIIVYLIVRKKAEVEIGLCEAHRAKRKYGIATIWSSVAVGLLVLCYGAVNNSGWGILIGVVIMLAGAITGGVMARLLTPTKIDKEYVWLAGAHRDFLADLPEWHGP